MKATGACCCIWLRKWLTGNIICGASPPYSPASEKRSATDPVAGGRKRVCRPALGVLRLTRSESALTELLGREDSERSLALLARDADLRYLESGGLHRSPHTGPDRMVTPT